MLIVSGDIPETGYNGISDKFHKFNYTSESCTPWQGVFSLIFHFFATTEYTMRTYGIILSLTS